MAEDKDKKTVAKEEAAKKPAPAAEKKEEKAKVEKKEKAEPKKKSTKSSGKKGDVKPLLKDYDVIRRPVITEKSQFATEYNKVTFVVRNNATKPEIKGAIERIFGVTVVSVNTDVRKGKVKRFRGTIGKQNDLKKAIVTLAEGDTIDFASNI